MFIGESSQDEEEEVKPVTVKFAHQESEEAKARRMASFDYLQKKQQEETWQQLEYHNINVCTVFYWTVFHKASFTYHYLFNLCFYIIIHQSGRAESRRLQLYAGKADELSEFQLQPGEYLQALMPETDPEQE